jgi:hypothetical protein
MDDQSREVGHDDAITHDTLRMRIKPLMASSLVTQFIQ